MATPYSFKGPAASVARWKPPCRKLLPRLRWKQGETCAPLSWGRDVRGWRRPGFLAAQGQSVVLTDTRPGPEPALELDLAKDGIPGVWGGHPESLLEQCGELIISPGIPPSVPFVAAAHSRGIPVIGEVELAHRALRARKDGSRVLAVTGTNGKSTTTDLVAHLLRASGLPAVACGNLGTPLIEAVAAGAPGLDLRAGAEQLPAGDRRRPSTRRARRS